MSAVHDQIILYPAISTVSPTQYVRTAAVDANDIVEIDLGPPFAKVGMVRFRAKHAGGAAATFTPYIFSKSGVTTPKDIAQEYVGANTVVADLFDPDLTSPQVMVTDENGKLYLMLAPNAGANNVFDITLRFIKYL